MSSLTTHTKNVKNWGTLKVARVIPVNGDIWGVFRPLVGTEWEPLFSTVSGEELSNALYGFINTFLIQVGDLPRLRMSRLGTRWTCSLFTSKHCLVGTSECYPGSKITLPSCYKVPSYEGISEHFYELLDYIRRDYYIVLVDSAGFTI